MCSYLLIFHKHQCVRDCILKPFNLIYHAEHFKLLYILKFAHVGCFVKLRPQEFRYSDWVDHCKTLILCSFWILIYVLTWMHVWGHLLATSFEVKYPGTNDASIFIKALQPQSAKQSQLIICRRIEDFSSMQTNTSEVHDQEVWFWFHLIT